MAFGFHGNLHPGLQYPVSSYKNYCIAIGRNCQSIYSEKNTAIPKSVRNDCVVTSLLTDYIRGLFKARHECARAGPDRGRNTSRRRARQLFGTPPWLRVKAPSPARHPPTPAAWPQRPALQSSCSYSAASCAHSSRICWSSGESFSHVRSEITCISGRRLCSSCTK